MGKGIWKPTWYRDELSSSPGITRAYLRQYFRECPFHATLVLSQLEPLHFDSRVGACIKRFRRALSDYVLRARDEDYWTLFESLRDESDRDEEVPGQLVAVPVSRMPTRLRNATRRLQREHRLFRRLVGLTECVTCPWCNGKGGEFWSSEAGTEWTECSMCEERGETTPGRIKFCIEEESAYLDTVIRAYEEEIAKCKESAE